jgi:hypothetical protein
VSIPQTEKNKENLKLFTKYRSLPVFFVRQSLRVRVGWAYLPTNIPHIESKNMTFVNPVKLIKIGCCPHGLPHGACPICNGSGGTGGSSSNSIKKVSGEMSWDECYAIGQMLKAARQNAEANKNLYENHLAQNVLLSKIALIAAENASKLKNFFLQLPAVHIVSNIAGKVNNFVKQVTNVIFTPVKVLTPLLSIAFNMIKAELINISDKLAAIWGERENILRKFISDNLEKTKQKLFNFLGFVQESVEQSENAEEIENQKRRFSKILKVFKKYKEKK